MLKAWYTYADRVGRYEAGTKDTPRVATLVAVTYALLGVGISWPLLVERQDASPAFWLGVPMTALVIAIVLAIYLERFHPLGQKDTTHSRTIIALLLLGWAVICVLLDFQPLLMFAPFWCMFALDALAHITKILGSAQQPDSNLPNPRTPKLPN
jgi:hypothetical protein